MKQLWQFPYLKSRLKAQDICISDHAPLPHVINILLDILEENGVEGNICVYNPERGPYQDRDTVGQGSSGERRALLAEPESADCPQSLRENGFGYCA